MNRPSITLFGPTPVSRVYQTDINKVLKSPSVVDPFKLDKQDFSIKQIKAGQVIELAKSLLPVLP
jgi:heptosyltransferase-1